MYIDHKITVWERIYINDEEAFNVAVETLRNGGTISEILEVDGNFRIEAMPETEGVIDVEDNDGHPTIEVYDGHDSRIWHNSTDNYDIINPNF